MQPSMTGKTVVVTGGTSGIGEETARALAAMGARVLLTGRNRERGEAICADIQAQGGAAELLLADLSTLAGVRALAAAIGERVDRLDVLVNNAGLILPERRETADGYEMTFAVNHLAPFLLTHLLMPVLRAAEAARVVNVSSAAHRFGRLDLDDLMTERARYRPFRVYGTTKLCNILFTKELARRLRGTPMTTNALHPGTIATGFGRDSRGLFRLLLLLVKPFLRRPKSGARTQIYLASSPDVAGVSGAYFVNCRQRKPRRAARNPALALGLWERSEALAKLAADERIPPPPEESAAEASR